VYLLWWVQHKHVSPPVVAAVLAAGELAITALEVPTGWLADRFGHRRSLIAGSAVQVGAMLTCWLGQGVSGVLAASLCVALGDAFRSGADQALLYRSCAATDGANRFQHIESTTRSVELMALVALMLMGTALVEMWGFGAAWLAETAAAGVGLALALTMVEPPPIAAPDDASAGDEDTLHVTPDWWGTLTSILPLIIPASLLAAAASAAAFVAQIGGETDPRRVTLLVAAITVIEAVGAMASRRLRADRRTQGMLLAGGVLCAAMLLEPFLFLPGVLGLSLLVGIAEPLRAAAIQQTSADDTRAQASSWASAADKIASTCALLVAGAASTPRRSN
jgi:MFS family permease